MMEHTPRRPHRTPDEEADEDADPGLLPVEPDKGPVPEGIPLDLEHDRLNRSADMDQSAGTHATASGCEPSIVSWHAHVYFDPASTRPQAERVRAGIAQRFRVQLGRWHEVPIGPHTGAMYQVAFDVDVFADLVPWLALHREGLSVLVHPNTLAPRSDHLIHAIWLGTPLALRADVLPEAIGLNEESKLVPNT